MERYSISFEVDVFGEAQASALLDKLSQNVEKGVLLVRKEAQRVGYIHSDGKMRLCTLPPSGFSIVERFETYQGMINPLQPEWEYVAVPEGVNYSNDDFEKGKPFPTGIKIWRYHKWIDNQSTS